MDNDTVRMAGYYQNLMDGDTHQIEDAYALMLKLGLVDKDGEPTERMYE